MPSEAVHLDLGVRQSRNSKPRYTLTLTLIYQQKIVIELLDPRCKRIKGCSPVVFAHFLYLCLQKRHRYQSFY